MQIHALLHLVYFYCKIYMGFLFDIQEEVVRKTDSFESLKLEAEKCLSQNEELSKEKAEFESEIYAKVCT